MPDEHAERNSRSTSSTPMTDTEPYLDEIDQWVIDQAALGRAAQSWREFDAQMLAFLHQSNGQVFHLVNQTRQEIEKSKALIDQVDALLARSWLIPPA
jgi:hypothetical protein